MHPPASPHADEDAPRLPHSPSQEARGGRTYPLPPAAQLASTLVGGLSFSPHLAPSDVSEGTRRPAPQRSLTARLLVLEDNPDSGELLKTLLDDRYDVTLCSSFDAALDALQRTRFDILLLDINLGERRTGADLLRAARKLPGYDRVPAIACTAYATDNGRGDSWYEDAGFNGYVRKPFEIDDLFETLARVLSRSRR